MAATVRQGQLGPARVGAGEEVAVVVPRDVPLTAGVDEGDVDGCSAAQPEPPSPSEDRRRTRGERRRRVGVGVVAAVALVVVVASVGWMVTSSGVDAVPAGPPALQFDRDPSGLAIIPDGYDDDRAVPPVPPEVDPAYTVARVLADENPTDFGFPRIRGERVVLPVASTRSAPLAEAATPEQRIQALLAYDQAVRADIPTETNPPDLLSKRLELTPDELDQFGSHVDVIPGTQSQQAAYDLQDRVFDVADAQRPASLVLACSYDPVLGLVILDMSGPAPAVAAALAAEFGTDTVGLHLDPLLESSGTDDGPR